MVRHLVFETARLVGDMSRGQLLGTYVKNSASTSILTPRCSACITAGKVGRQAVIRLMLALGRRYFHNTASTP
jgi:hypothetical protein